ncbi:MAG TPA: hypothetical protein VFM18_02975, partial [Methanosarcina sp.]|nr:hypothetical protein [Methanosarcina sp.]
ATIASAISVYEMQIARVGWHVKAHPEATEAEKNRAKLIQTMMDDMEHSWFEFIKEVSSMYTFGFCVNEKVYRRRTYSNGSKYNDNYIGLRKLPVRSQDTISRWLWTDDSRDIVGVEQVFTYVDTFKTSNDVPYKVTIPRNKFLLFRTDAKRGNPNGRSPLVSCYVAWKIKATLEEHEAIGISRDMRGIPILEIPPKYMSADASDDEKAVYEYYKLMIRNLHKNEQTGVIIPNAYDPESKQPLFKFSLLGVGGQKTFDTNAIIGRWNNTILTALFADVLKMGQDQVGSFSLAGTKTNILSMAIEHRLKEIQTVLNQDLMVQIHDLNGWSKEHLPTFQYDDLEEVDMDIFSKFVQRVFSVNAMEFDREAANRIR